MKKVLNITIPMDAATPVVQRVLSGMAGSTRLAGYIGRSVQHEIGGYVLRLAATKHGTAEKLGASPTGFFADAYESVTSPGAVHATDKNVALDLPTNAFARAFGDVDIKPGPGKKFLTFAAMATAYGKRAGAFNNLTFGIAYDKDTGSWRPALVEAKATKVSFGRPRKDGTRAVHAFSSSTGLTAVFWLVRSAHQKQDRDLLPGDNQLSAAAMEGAAEYIAVLIQKSGGAA